MKKIELKVSIQCQKCKTEVLQAVTKISGMEKVSVDGEKGTLTVIGDVDPVLVATKVANLKPLNLSEKLLPPSCGQCQLVVLSYVPHGTGQFLQ